MSKSTKLVTKAEALTMLSAILRDVNERDVMCAALDLFAEIAGWNKLVRKHLKSGRKR